MQHIKSIYIVIPGLLLALFAFGKNYYVDAVSGRDSNSGLTTTTAWKTLVKVNSFVYEPGDRILFKTAQHFEGTLVISTSGTQAGSITYSTYGGKQPAVIDGKGDSTSIYSYNKEYIELINLGITNFRKGSMKIDDLFDGIYIVNSDAGTLHHFYFDHVKVFNVNSTIVAKDEGKTDQSRFHGGVQFRTIGNMVRSNFEDVLITNSTFENLSRTGFNFRSDWDDRTASSHWGDSIGKGLIDNWTPNTNVIIRNNVFKNVAGNALIVRVAVNALIEYNLVDSCGKMISGNAMFNFNTDSAVYQYNEVQHTVYNEGDVDARGIDADYRTKNTIIQYNYLHDNGLGGVCAIGGPGVGNDPVNFNIGTIIRYNILENNARQGIYASGRTESLQVYNNVVYADARFDSITAIKFNRWTVYPNGAFFKNNIFQFGGNHISYDFTSATNINFDHNIYFGIQPPSVFQDAYPIQADPKLAAPGTGANGYQLLPASPAVEAGVHIKNNTGHDYYGRETKLNPAMNIGIDSRSKQ